MTKQKPKAKVFIDGANIFYTQKDFGWSIDWEKMIKLFKKRWDVIEIKYYTGVRNDDDKMRGYLEYLDKTGVTPITKPLKKIRSKEGIVFKSNFDVEMTMDILLEREGIEEIILLTGGSDFHNLVRKLKDFGKKVIVFSSRRMISWELKLAASEYIFLEDLKKEIARK